MNATGRRIVNGCFAGLQAVDPSGAEELKEAMANLGGRSRENKVEALLLEQAEVARLYNCSRWTVRNLVRDGKLHPVTLRGARRYRRAEVLQLAGEVQS